MLEEGYGLTLSRYRHLGSGGGVETSQPTSTHSASRANATLIDSSITVVVYSIAYLLRPWKC